MYYIKKQPVTSFAGLETIENDYNTFHRALKDLAERKITGNNALNYITNIISLYTKEDQKFLIRILMKDLKIGLSKKGFENIFGKNSNDEYEVSLALNLDKVKGVNVLDGGILSCCYLGLRYFFYFIYDSFSLMTSRTI